MPWKLPGRGCGIVRWVGMGSGGCPQQRVEAPSQRALRRWNNCVASAHGPATQPAGCHTPSACPVLGNQESSQASETHNLQWRSQLLRMGTDSSMGDACSSRCWSSGIALLLCKLLLSFKRRHTQLGATATWQDQFHCAGQQDKHF